MNNKKFILDFSADFTRKYKKLIRNNLKLESRISETLKFLAKEPFYKGLKTHKVKLAGKVRFSSSVTGDLRIIWNFSNSKISILLLDIGGHDDVY